MKKLAAALKDVAPFDMAGAIELARNTGYTWRDIMSRAMVGRLIVEDYFVPAGIQQLLDEITTTIGALLVRTTAGWVGLNPTAAGYIMTDHGPGLPPSWEAPAAAGQTNLPIHVAGLDWGVTHATSANTISIGLLQAEPGMVITGIACMAAAAAATCVVTPCLYDLSGVTPHNLLATGPSLTGIVIGRNNMQLTAPYVVTTQALLGLGFVQHTSTITAPNNQAYAGWSGTTAGAPPNPAPTLAWSNANNFMPVFPF
jgi:hypothetical protein